MVDIFYKVGNSPKEVSAEDKGSFRQAILNSVTASSEEVEPTKIKRTPAEYRELWKQAIRQTILLIRMERENANLLAKQNENEIKKIKLDYDTIIKCDRQLVDRWETIMERHSSKIATKRDPKVLFQAIKNGVPRAKRGEVWTFLAEQHSLHTAPVDTKNFPMYHTPYPVLLKSLTEHQHAIFIDLGRTFPNHVYYK
uniref:Rab-GAP TBC domain-containing protein n=1 Tax=Megaselia scalaris TaxID=36166 RepID=T1GZB7_MEGSC